MKKRIYAVVMAGSPNLLKRKGFAQNNNFVPDDIYNARYFIFSKPFNTPKYVSVSPGGFKRNLATVKELVSNALGFELDYIPPRRAQSSRGEGGGRQNVLIFTECIFVLLPWCVTVSTASNEVQGIFTALASVTIITIIREVCISLYQYSEITH